MMNMDVIIEGCVNFIIGRISNPANATYCKCNHMFWIWYNITDTLVFVFFYIMYDIMISGDYHTIFHDK